MKKLIFIILLMVASFSSSNAQVVELVTLITNKVIKAIDLKIQEMQNAVIALQNAQRQAENLLSKQQLSEIALWNQKQKELFRDYYTSLTQAKPALAISLRVQRMVDRQKEIVALYKHASIVIKNDKQLGQNERQDFLQSGFAVLNNSYDAIRKLNEVLQPSTITSTDAGRLQLIGVCENQIDMQYGRMKMLFDGCRLLSENRVKIAEETIRVQQLYGL
jgi:hypothetical protein